MIRTAPAIAAIALYASAALASPPSAPPGMQWVSVPQLSDEFDGARLDPQKWRATSGYKWTGNMPFTFSPGNVSVEDGALILRTTSRLRSYDDLRDPMKEMWLNTAIVTSIYSGASYGYYEARLKAAALSMASAFWMKGNERPEGGRLSEIDITEEIGTSEELPDTAHKFKVATHYFADGHAMSKTTIAEPWSPDPVTEWHTYGAWWKDAHTVWFYLNGVKVSEQTFPNTFTENMEIFFDTELRARYGLPKQADMADNSKNAMRVDWVRSYRLVPQQ